MIHFLPLKIWSIVTSAYLVRTYLKNTLNSTLITIGIVLTVFLSTQQYLYLDYQIAKVIIKESLIFIIFVMDRFDWLVPEAVLRPLQLSGVLLPF